jgi:hypothetical protein
LLLVTIAGGADVLTGPFRPQFVDAIALRLRIAPAPAPAAPLDASAGDPVGSIIGALLGRIVVMQVAIIGGAWVASRWGSLAPLAIMVGIKTVFDFGHRAAR